MQETTLACPSHPDERLYSEVHSALMDSTHAEERPHKKRRFFREDSSPVVESIQRFSPPPPVASEHSRGDATSPIDIPPNGRQAAVQDGFDVSLLTAVVGELSSSVIDKLKTQSGNDVQRAINIYLDGSWSSTPLASETRPALAPLRQPSLQSTIANGLLKRHDSEASNASAPGSGASTPVNSVLKAMPARRYIGSFGAIGWATKSGKGLLKHDEKIAIERAKIREPSGKRRIGKKQDVVVRFTNERGEEVGRLENEFAAWTSTLIDQKMCSFEGSCVYAPERLRTSETVYLQLRCYLLRGAFDKRKFVKPDNNRDVNLFEEKESQDEKDLRLRQVALVKLFEAISLDPSRVNETTNKHKRQGLLQAAESAETKEQKSKPKIGSAAEPGPSPPSEEAEEGEELEQDQLDSLYAKAQSFDFNTPAMDPASTFSLDLRKYQKQALHWMVGKERDEALEHKEVSMHPLWEEYRWPTQDANNSPIPIVNDQDMFYVNPYSGELSLEFPKQEQNCLGGILADGECRCP